MANNTYITEALERLNRMSRMSDSKKSLKESQNRGRDDYKSYILNSLKDSGYLNFAKIYSGYDFYESNGHNVVIDNTAKKIEIPDNMSIERIVRELTSKSRTNSYNESSRRGLTEAEMSPEDAADTQVLRNIQDKIMIRPSSARLNKKELAVLDKYGLYYDKDRASLRYSDSGITFTGLGNLRGIFRRDPRKINLADSARKHQDRLLARRSTDSAVRDAGDRYRDMEIALGNRKNAMQDLDRDTSNTEYLDGYPHQGPVPADSLGRWVGTIRAGREYGRNLAQNRIDKSQHEINRLLRRDESYKKRLKESEGSEIIAQYSIDVYEDKNMPTEKMEKLIMDILENNGLTVAGCMSTDTSWSVEDYYG